MMATNEEARGSRGDEVPELEELHLEPRPDGPGAAVMVAAGTGILVLGVLTVLAEASEAIHDWIESFDFDRGVGPLAGKTILAAGAFFVTWLVLGIAMRGRQVALARWFWFALLLGVIGAVLLFPPVFTAFASE
jgi:hypothetical protein